MNIISIRDLDRAYIVDLIEKKSEHEKQNKCRSPWGTLACIFEQPSLRTASSFASAAVESGLIPVFINTSGGSEFRSQTNLEDEIHQLSLTGAKCIVVRTAKELNANALRASSVPIISGGDGSNEHPTQALVDLMTMEHLNGIEGKKIVLMGNARDHRTLHSLALALEYFDTEVTLIHPIGMDLADRYRTKNMTVMGLEDKSQRRAILEAADYVYISPIKFNNNPHLIDHKGVASLNLSEAQMNLKPSAKVLHPFPRFGELAMDLDYSIYDAYHLQASMSHRLRVRLFHKLFN